MGYKLNREVPFKYILKHFWPNPDYMISLIDIACQNNMVRVIATQVDYIIKFVYII